MRPAKYSQDETKARILEAADTLIGQHGFQKTTIADIAKLCGFSPANVHKFFGTKAAIQHAIADKMLNRMLDSVTARSNTAQSAEDRLRVFVTMLNQATRKRFEDRTQLFESLSRASREQWEETRKFRMRICATLEDILRDGQDSGEFDITDIPATALALHMSLFRLFHPAMVVEAQGEPDEGSADLQLDFLIRALKSKAE